MTLLVFCVTLNRNNLEIVANQMNLNTNLDFKEFTELKLMLLVTSSNLFPYLNSTKMLIIPTSGVSKKSFEALNA